MTDAYRLQVAILGGVTVVFLVYSALFLPAHWLRSLFSALLVAGLFVLGNRLGPSRRPTIEAIVGFGVAALLFGIPVAGGAPPRGHGFVAAGIAAFAAQGAWALHRYPLNPTPSARWLLSSPLLSRTLVGALFGFVIALLLIAYVAILVAVAILTDNLQGSRALANDLAVLSLGYVGAGVIGGVGVGALAPMIRWPLGAAALGIPLAATVYGIVAVAAEGMEVLADGTGPGGIGLAEALVVLLFIGPMWGTMIKGWIEA